MAQRQRRQLVESLNVSVATGILLHHMLSSARQ
jgi:tRNA G18 (ribose-2'-O)-methylase SpoU